MKQIKRQIVTDGPEETIKLASSIGYRLKGGEIIELISDLGGGKTTFVRGLASGMGSKDKVSSPSFTITNQYQGRDLTIMHIDLYRLSEAGIIKDEIIEMIGDLSTIVVVEWADIIKGILPLERLRVTFLALGETKRQINFALPDTLKYLIEGFSL